MASGQRAGAEVPVWLDGRGDLVMEPLSPTEAAIESGLMGTAAALGVTGIAFGTGALAGWRLERRRIDQWGREWDLVGPECGHKTG
ncbi:Rv1733c family protein [Streptomyces chartreusis]